MHFLNTRLRTQQEEGEGGAPGTSSLRNVTEDMKRALGALSSAESKVGSSVYLERTWGVGGAGVARVRV
jgi:hypothetical protein